MIGQNDWHWSKTAIMCFKRNCRCKGCEIYLESQQCKMKQTVIKLVAKLGVPNGH